MFSTQKSRGYRQAEPLDSNTPPPEALKGSPPQLMSANMSDLTTGQPKANLEPMLRGLPEGTKQQVGLAGYDRAEREEPRAAGGLLPGTKQQLGV